eukprot:jgi/Orpsp1_1/1180797/evm.model.c7180000074657.2
MNYSNNNKIESFILNFKKIQNSLKLFSTQLQLLYENEKAILEQLIEKSNYHKAVNIRNNNLKEYKENIEEIKGNNEDYLCQLIEKSERILNHPYIKSQYKIEELTIQKKKLNEENNTLKNNNIKNNNKISERKIKNDLKIKSSDNFSEISSKVNIPRNY